MTLLFHEMYRKEHSLEKRLNEVNNILKKYPYRIPVLISTNSKDINLERHKYLVPRDITLSQFGHILRNNIKCSKEETLFYLVGDKGVIPKMTSIMSDLYKYNKSEDNYLLLIVQKENAFG